MKIIIVGNGKMGAALAAQLSAENHDITIIDSDSQVLGQTTEILDVMSVTGNGASMATLREAGAEDADLLIAATGRDEINLLACLTARKLGATHTIARNRNPEYAEQFIVMREELGLSLTVNPEYAAAQEAYQLLQFPSFLKRESFAKGRVEIVAIPVEERAKLDGIPLYKLYERAGVNVLVCAVERGEGVHIPGGSFVLRGGDTIYVTAVLQNLARLIRNLGLVERKVKSVLMIGGSQIALYLARRCLDSGISVKIIERDHNRCVKLAEALPEATVIEADGARQDILNAEGVRYYDAMITLTGMDEENLVLSILAGRMGVGKVITKINRIEYTDVFRKLGIGSIISPKGLCCTDIVRYVRAMTSASGIESMVTLHSIVDGKVEALEFRAGADTRHCGEPLKSIPLKSGILISCIVHQGRTLLPKGDTCFYPGDTVIVVTAWNQTINDLDNIFAD